MSTVKLRKNVKEIFTELHDILNTLEAYVMVERPLRTQDITELSWLMSLAEERVSLYGKYMYEQGKAERGLFDE